MEDKLLDAQQLKSVSGGNTYSHGWNIGEEVKIDSGNPLCPDCGNPLRSAGYYPEKGFDAFQCRCGKYYVRFYIGDIWYRAYPIH